MLDKCLASRLNEPNLQFAMIQENEQVYKFKVGS
jgi:hypothetical protein